MGLVKDHQINQRLVFALGVKKVGQLLPIPTRLLFLRCPLVSPGLGRSCSVVTDDPCSAITQCLPWLVEPIKQSRRINNVCVDAEPIPKLVAPLLPQHGGAHNNQAPEIQTCPEFSPYQAGFDGLTETNLVGEQKARGRRIQEGQQRAVLVRVEIGISDSHRIDEVREAPRQVDVGQTAPEISRASVSPFSGKGERIASLSFLARLKLVLMTPVDQTVRPLDLTVGSGKLSAKR